jgi:hypothetical protein
MEDFKFVIFSIIILAILGFSGYWAFGTIESGSTHMDNQVKKELEDKNRQLAKEVSDLKNQVSLLNVEKETDTIKSESEAIVDNTPKEDTEKLAEVKSTILKYQSLIDELQKLVDGNIYLKNKSQGPAVGSIQKFLNIYNNTNNKVDNDYGVSTSNGVKIFQKDIKITVDGETGPNTYKKMITWLKTK